MRSADDSAMIIRRFLQRPLHRYILALALIALSLPFWPWALKVTLKHIVTAAPVSPSPWTVVEQNSPSAFPNPGKALPGEDTTLPNWTILPAASRIFAIEAYPEIDGYGSVVSAIVAFESSPDEFMDSFENSLVTAGYHVERTTVSRTMSGDGEWSMEAHHAVSGRAIFARVRRFVLDPRRVAQLWYSDAPVPEH